MRSRRFPSAIVVAAALLALPAPASVLGHGAESFDSLSEHALQDQQLERVQARAERHWRALSPSQRARARDRTRTREQRIRANLRRAPGLPSDVGKWTTKPFALPNFAVHAAVLPTGELIFWGSPPFPTSGPRDNIGQAAVWNPSAPRKKAFRNVRPPLIDVDGDGSLEPTPIYCSGLSLLPSGALLVAGGNRDFPNNDPDDEFTGFAGLNSLLTFDPWSRTWTRQPAMQHGRWYPSQVELADGRTVIYGGYTEEAPGGVIGSDLEVFSPSADPAGVGTLELMESAERSSGLYPHLFTLADGSVLMEGPDPVASALLDTDAFTWDETWPEPLSRGGGTEVLRAGPDGAPEALTAIGGYPYSGGDFVPARRTTETLDVVTPQAGWQPAEQLKVGRSYHNTVVLPDDSLLTVGGGSGYSTQDGNFTVSAQARQRKVELLAPDGAGWQLGPAQHEDRSYHSIALLLPDGRVFSAGDDLHPLQPDGAPSLNDTAEIYSPPYLFKGERPQITGAPASLGYGEGADIQTVGNAQSAVLVAPGATTHAVDMQQRLVHLIATPTPEGGLHITAPANGALAPSGYYMLFVLNAEGVPSVARWVHLA